MAHARAPSLLDVVCMELQTWCSRESQIGADNLTGFFEEGYAKLKIGNRSFVVDREKTLDKFSSDY